MYCGNHQVYFVDSATVNFRNEVCPEDVTPVLGISLTAADARAYHELVVDITPENTVLCTTNDDCHPEQECRFMPMWEPEDQAVPPNFCTTLCGIDEDCEDPDQCVLLNDPQEEMFLQDTYCGKWDGLSPIVENPALSLKVWFLDTQYVHHFRLDDPTMQSLIDEEGACLDVLNSLTDFGDDRDYLAFSGNGQHGHNDFYTSDQVVGGGYFEICLDSTHYCHDDLF